MSIQGYHLRVILLHQVAKAVDWIATPIDDIQSECKGMEIRLNKFENKSGKYCQSIPIEILNGNSDGGLKKNKMRLERPRQIIIQIDIKITERNNRINL
jgi:hypothetical protein